MNQQVRFCHHVQADGADSVALRIGELMVVTEEVEARPHRRQHIVNHGLPAVDAVTGWIEGARGFVRQEDVDARQGFSDGADVRRPFDAGRLDAGV